MHCSSGSPCRCGGRRFRDDMRSGSLSRLSRRAAPTRIANPLTTAPRVHFGLMRTCQAPHGFLSRHIGPIEPGVFVARNGSISLFTPHHHDRPSTHLRQRQRRASFKVGAPSAGHQAAVSDEENTFHLHLSRPPHLALESLTHQSSF